MITTKCSFYAGAAFITLAMLIVSACCSVQESDGVKTAKINGVRYTYCITNGVVMIGGGDERYTAVPTNTAGVLKIPSTLRGRPVELIAPGAFEHCENLTEIIIPDSITNIGSRAFSSCASLRSITISKNLVAIEKPGEMFDYCHQLTTINVDNDNPDYKSVNGILFDKSGTTLLFYPRTKQGAYTVPDNVETIERLAFGRCLGLTSVTLPPSVREIQFCAFAACSNLTAVSLNEGLRSIKAMAFYECTRLSAITLPKSIDYIGGGILMGCHSLVSIPVDPQNAKYESIDGVVFKKEGPLLMTYPCGRKGPYSVPDGVKRLYSANFRDSIGLTSLAIPASVEEIGSSLVNACSNLTAITVEPTNANFASIDGVLFDKACTNLLLYPEGKQGAYTIPQNVRHLATSAFRFCNGLTAIIIPDGIREIPFCAFAYCNNLIAVTIPNSVTNVNPAAFYECANITSVTIPPCVTNLQETFPHSYEKITNVVRLSAQNNRSSGDL